MKTTEYECKINGLHIAEVTIKRPVDRAPQMEAVYATIEGKQATHGRCTAFPTNWSPGTLKLLNDLLESMEQDLLPRHFKIPAGLEREDERTGPGTVEEADQI